MIRELENGMIVKISGNGKEGKKGFLNREMGGWDKNVNIRGKGFNWKYERTRK